MAVAAAPVLGAAASGPAVAAHADEPPARRISAGAHETRYLEAGPAAEPAVVMIHRRPEIGLAVASLECLGRSATLLPGALTKFLHGALIGLPRSAKVRAMGRIMKGMT